MQIKNLISEIPDYLRLGLGVLAFVVCSLFALPELEQFIQIPGMIVVAVQVLPAAFRLRF